MIRQTKARTLHFKTRMLGIALLIPAAVLIAYVMIIPIGWNFVLSFAKWNGFSNMQLVGLDNYSQLFQDTLTLKTFENSIFLAIVSSLIAILLGLFLALLVYRLGKYEGAGFRLIFFIPSVIPTVVIGLLFTFILNPESGLINHFFQLIGLESLNRAWLGEPGIVMWTLSAISGWKGSGAVMMLLFTAMITIPTSMFEAAKLEGASYFQQIRIIILPLISPTIRLVSMLVLIGSFKAYDIVATMTKGGPGDYSKVVPLQMLDTAFSYNEFGYSAAIGVMFTLLVAIILFIAQKFVKGDAYEY